MMAVPATMRAAQVLRYGLGRENFAVNGVPVGADSIEDDEVLVKVYACSSNPADYKLARGMRARAREGEVEEKWAGRAGMLRSGGGGLMSGEGEELIYCGFV